MGRSWTAGPSICGVGSTRSSGEHHQIEVRWSDQRGRFGRQGRTAGVAGANPRRRRSPRSVERPASLGLSRRPPRRAQFRPPGGPGLVDAGLVTQQLSLPVGRHAESVEPKGECIRVHGGVEFTLGFRPFDVAAEHGHPFTHHPFHRVPQRPRSAVHLGRGGAEETATGEDVGAQVVTPGVTDRPQSGQAGCAGPGGFDDLLDEDGAGPGERRELQLHFGSEERMHTALVQTEIGRQHADGEALEAVARRQLHGPLEHRGPALLAADSSAVVRVCPPALLGQRLLGRPGHRRTDPGAL